jgi:hypothetical protein
MNFIGLPLINEFKYTKNEIIEEIFDEMAEKLKNITGNISTTISTREPDSSFARYRVDQFKSTKARQVPYEKLDYNIYKASSNVVAFTTEERIVKWTKTIILRYHVGLDINDNTYSLKSLWEEQASQNDDSKCDKITVHLSRKDSKHNENIVAVIIYVSTGRIQIQGKYLLEWGDSEFIALLNIVNAIRDGEISDEIQESSVNDLGMFIDPISTANTLEIQENFEI